MFNDDASRRRMTELVRAAAPDIVITASPQDYHPDHEAVSVLVRDACFASSVPNYRTGAAAALARFEAAPEGPRARAAQAERC